MPLQAKCPICRKVSIHGTNECFPFCSERCRLIDLGQWADEKYVIPGESTQPSTKHQEDEDRDR